MNLPELTPLTPEQREEYGLRYEPVAQTLPALSSHPFLVCNACGCVRHFEDAEESADAENSPLNCEQCGSDDLSWKKRL